MSARASRASIGLVLAALVGACDQPGGRPDLIFSLNDFWPDLRGYPGIGSGRLVVTNNFSDSVSLLDLSQVASPDLHELARVPVGFNPVEREGPHHVAADARGDYYYVGISNYVPGSGSGPHGTHGSGTADGHALKIRASDNVTVASVRVDRNPGDIRLTPDGSRLLMSHFDLLRVSEVMARGGDPSEMNARLAIIDPAAMTRVAMVTICPAPHGIAVSPDSRTAYATCQTDELAIVDLARDDHPVRRIAVLGTPSPASSPLCAPYAVTRSPNGDSVWVSCLENGQVHRYDVAGDAIDTGRTATLPGPALFGTFTRDGQTLIIAHQRPDGFAWINSQTGALDFDLTPTREQCTNPHAAALTDDQTWLIGVCEGNHVTPGTLVVIQMSTRTVEKSVPLGIYPDDVAFLRGNQ